MHVSFLQVICAFSPLLRVISFSSPCTWHRQMEQESFWLDFLTFLVRYFVHFAFPFSTHWIFPLISSGSWRTCPFDCLTDFGAFHMSFQLRAFLACSRISLPFFAFLVRFILGWKNKKLWRIYRLMLMEGDSLGDGRSC